MKSLIRPVLGLALVSSLATLLTSCDYKYSPGVNPQTAPGFGTPPGYTSVDVDRDSINNRQITTIPVGKGSATAIKNGSVNDQLNSAPGGDNTTSPQAANGQMGSVNQNMEVPTTPTSDKNKGMTKTN